MHAHTSGHDTFNFEMLHESFREQVRASSSAPVQLHGGSIGMMRCSRAVLMGAFEALAEARILTVIAAKSQNVAKEFVKWRCAVDYETVKKAVNKRGETSLKKWLNKAQ